MYAVWVRGSTATAIGRLLTANLGGAGTQPWGSAALQRVPLMTATVESAKSLTTTVPVRWSTASSSGLRGVAATGQVRVQPAG